MDTIQIIKDRLEGSKGTWPVVCEKTGLDYSWLTKFAQGKIPNPGYAKVFALAEYFGVSGSGKNRKQAA